jgi:hypothetical protein
MKTEWNYQPDESLIIFERNGIGEGLAQILTQTEQAIEYLEMPIFYDNKGKAGIHTGQTLKNKLALQFKNLVEYNKMIINDALFVDELYGFVRNSVGSYAGKSGYHDDRVTCAFLMVYYLMNVFADFAQGDFSVDNMMLVKKEDKLINTSNVEQDPAVLYRERMKKEAASEAELIEAAKKAEREAYAQQAAMGSSIVEEDDEEKAKAEKKEADEAKKLADSTKEKATFEKMSLSSMDEVKDFVKKLNTAKLIPAHKKELSDKVAKVKETLSKKQSETTPAGKTTTSTRKRKSETAQETSATIITPPDAIQPEKTPKAKTANNKAKAKTLDAIIEEDAKSADPIL